MSGVETGMRESGGKKWALFPWGQAPCPRTVSRDLGHLRSRGSSGSSDPVVRTASAYPGVVINTEDVAGVGRGHACLHAWRQAKLAPTPPPSPRLAYLSADTHQLFMRLWLHLFGRSWPLLLTHLPSFPPSIYNWKKREIISLFLTKQN